MSISVLTNMPSVNVKRHLGTSSEAFQTAAERIASGRRINRPMDDAAGLSMSYSLEAKIRSISQARRNSLEALSMIQVAEGGMNEVGNLIVRLRELSIQAASDTISDREREMLELEVTQIKEEVDRLAEATRYFDTPLLNGAGKQFVFQIGIENTDANRLTYDASAIDVRSSKLGVDGVSLKTVDDARDSFEAVDEALKRMNLPRAAVGALQSRMHAIANNLESYEENMIAAKSRIVDADLAKESGEAIKAQVLQRSGIAILTQANQLPTMALKLLEG